MALMCDRYRPTSLSKLYFNEEQATHLKRMIESVDFPNLLIYGESGSGKKTRIQCILKEIFGNGVTKTKIEMKTIEIRSGKSVEIKVISSNYHLEVNPSDVNIYDRYVVQNLIKTTAQTKSLFEKLKFKIIVIHEAHKLTKEAQHSLRRTIEKYLSTTRIILNANTISTIIPPIQSRTLCIRVPRPSVLKLTQYIQEVAKKENISITKEVAQKIVLKSERNIRKALLMLETMKVKGSTDSIPLTIYEQKLDAIADKIVHNQTVKMIEEIRNDFYELQLHLIPIDFIYISITRGLLKRIQSEQLKEKIISSAAYYQHNSTQGNKHIYHFEAFIAQIMTFFKEV
ncbi:replication factor C subunit 3-like protein [Leptotrombidium deliense]|uniref:Replication factor C subunit 3-like protein n=1 Tax=Leptotrombidium deliense TaxID=299467 RepID=A0A443ST44_9ACAR|nr:replication factor C subunit 3-like protein [Leptotrombidium deliense]